VKEKKLFSNIECYHLGSSDPGLVVIEGKLIRGVRPDVADRAVEEEIERLNAGKIDEKELTKVKNKTESAILFEDMSLMSRASNLAMYELMGDAEYMNTELRKYKDVTQEEILEAGTLIFDKKNSNTLFYHSNN
jgi:predicted Zn-dependent peptidase